MELGASYYSRVIVTRRWCNV